jgi:large subunit ribosomal protein L3
MSIGLVGRKIGMTQIFVESGESIPVTVIEATPNRVVTHRTEENNGYTAIQVTMGTCKANRITKSLAGHYAKSDVVAGSLLKEFRLDNEQALEKYAVGSEITVDLFQAEQLVDVTGISKGKGFAGAIKRHNFSGQDNTHGNSLSHRAPGSIGQNQSPGRVFKGKKMAGQMGNKQITVQNQKVVSIDLDKNLILIKGVVPGAPGSNVIIRPAVKAKTSEENK